MVEHHFGTNFCNYWAYIEIYYRRWNKFYRWKKIALNKAASMAVEYENI